MGNFIGHVCPGLFLTVSGNSGLYQAIVVSRAVIFSDSLLYPPCSPKNKGKWARLCKIAYEGLLKIAAGSFLIVYEIISIEGGLILMNREMPPRFVNPKEWQHLTMFILLTLNGCVDVVSKSVLPQRCVVVEKGALVLSFYELLLLLVSHIKDSSGVQLQVRALLILVVFLMMLVLTAELWAPEVFHLWMTETFLIMVMGSWLVQAGFILYRPISGYSWEDEDISDLMFVTTFFCWHVMTDALCLLGIYGFSSFWYYCLSPSLKLMRSKKASYCETSSGPLYSLLQEVEEPEKNDQALPLSKGSH
ncbi:LOW QUALITY PROTEIN: transmembrane epididymal protein 1 [Ctenodactylus gundi]